MSTKSCLSPTLWWWRRLSLLLMIRWRTSRRIGVYGSVVMVAVTVTVAVIVLVTVVMSVVVGAVIGQRESGDGQNLKITKIRKH